MRSEASYYLWHAVGWKMEHKRWFWCDLIFVERRWSIKSVLHQTLIRQAHYVLINSLSRTRGLSTCFLPHSLDPYVSSCKICCHEVEQSISIDLWFEIVRSVFNPHFTLRIDYNLIQGFPCRMPREIFLPMASKYLLALSDEQWHCRVLDKYMQDTASARE